MYANIYTRANLTFTMRILGKFQTNPEIDHWKAPKKVIKYL